MTMPPRIPINEAQIDRVVACFYRRIRAHAVLGPIFAKHVNDWPAHEDRIRRFWRNALLFERCYDGNPMQVHQAAGDVTVDHFPAWLSLFDKVLEQELPDRTADAWSSLAHRIGRGLSYGLSLEGAIPRLRSD